MHIHHNPIANVSAQIHSAPAAAQRATETRRKLLNGTASMKEGGDDEFAGEISSIARWSEDNSEKRKQSSSCQRQNPGEEESEVNPVSVWA